MRTLDGNFSNSLLEKHKMDLKEVAAAANLPDSTPNAKENSSGNQQLKRKSPDKRVVKEKNIKKNKAKVADKSDVVEKLDFLEISPSDPDFCKNLLGK